MLAEPCGKTKLTQYSWFKLELLPVIWVVTEKVNGFSDGDGILAIGRQQSAGVLENSKVGGPGAKVDGQVK